MDSAEEDQDIVIVGGGICGLATALALHRKGLKCVVLEKSDGLRQTGAAIGVLANGWRALDQLGVGAELRQKAVLIQGGRDIWIEEEKQEDLQFLTGEARCLKRVDLINALANALPSGTIRFQCQIVNVKMDPPNVQPTLHSYDGKCIRTKNLIGCDGSRSIVADFLGLKPSKSFALCATRGWTNYSDGHSFSHEFVRMRKNKILFGRIPINDNLVYWFVAQPSTPFVGNDLKRLISLTPTSFAADANLPNDPELIKQLTLQATIGFPADMVEMIDGCDLDSLSFARLRYRPPWEILVGRFCRGPVTVAGDAMHVMGPFLGQGGSAGIEDAVVLARNVVEKVGLDEYGREGREIGKAFHDYVEERRMRVLRLSTQTYLIGLILEAASPMLRFIAVILMNILFSDQGGHTKYDCGHL